MKNITIGFLKSKDLSRWSNLCDISKKRKLTKKEYKEYIKIHKVIKSCID